VRLVSVAALLVSGCVALDGGDSQLTADLAVETAVALVASSTPDAPDDQPKPGDTCPNCDGRGYVGDGVVREQCQPCAGGGRVLGSVLVHPAAAPCASGKCPPTSGVRR